MSKRVDNPFLDAWLANRERTRIWDTRVGRLYLENLVRLNPSPLTQLAVARVLADDGARYTLDEVAAEMGVELERPAPRRRWLRRKGKR